MRSDFSTLFSATNWIKWEPAQSRNNKTSISLYRYRPRPHPSFRIPPLHRDAFNDTQMEHKARVFFSTDTQEVQKDIQRVHLSPELNGKIRVRFLHELKRHQIANTVFFFS